MCNNHNYKKQHHENNLHDEAHKKWNRRSFLQALGLAGAGTMMVGGMPLSASNSSRLAAAISQSETDRILVLILYAEHITVDLILMPIFFSLIISLVWIFKGTKISNYSKYSVILIALIILIIISVPKIIH